LSSAHDFLLEWMDDVYSESSEGSVACKERIDKSDWGSWAGWLV